MYIIPFKICHTFTFVKESRSIYRQWLDYYHIISWWYNQVWRYDFDITRYDNKTDIKCLFKVMWLFIWQAYKDEVSLQVYFAVIECPACIMRTSKGFSIIQNGIWSKTICNVLEGYEYASKKQSRIYNHTCRNVFIHKLSESFR